MFALLLAGAEDSSHFLFLRILTDSLTDMSAYSLSLSLSVFGGLVVCTLLVIIIFSLHSLARSMLRKWKWD